MPSEDTPSTSADEQDAEGLRRELVRRIATFDGPWGDEQWSPEVLKAMEAVPRHRFVGGVGLPAAYQDRPLPIGHGQTISQPTVVALMTQALHLEGDERVLEVGTGSGYQAAVLSEMLPRGHLHTIERIPELGARARRALRERSNVTVHIGDGYAGLPSEGPFDRVLLTAAPPVVPRPLVDQLRHGGLLLGPIGQDQQMLVRYRSVAGRLRAEELGAVRFVPMVPGSP